MFNLIEQFDLGDKVDDMLSLTPAPPHDEDGYSHLFLTGLPSKNYSDALFPKIQKLIHEKSSLKSHKIRDFNFSVEDVVDALENTPTLWGR